MQVDLSIAEIRTLLESLRHLKQRVEDTVGTPSTVKRENIERLELVIRKLTAAQANEA